MRTDPPHPFLGTTLDKTVTFVRRFVVFSDAQADTVALWNAHTYVYDCAPATPYLHPHSPEPSSGKTTLLDVLELTAKNAIQADNLTEAVLFRLVDAERPTLLCDEIDAVFGKKHSDSTEGIRQVLNSGYQKGKKVYRCVPPTHRIQGFEVYCPKTLAGLNELPGTLASRAIPIKMKPPRPEEHYEELADEDLEVESQAEILRITLQSWADEAGDVLRDPRRKPAKLPGLNARGNQIWRILFRIADQAGGDWPARARRAALELSGIAARHEDASVGVRLLGHIRDVFDADRMTCSDLANALNADEEMPYGAWNDGKGISTRELGRKLAPYEVKASSTRIGDARGNGYRRGQFEDVWARYLAEPGEPNRDTVTTRMAQSKKDGQEPGQLRPVTVPEGGVNPDEHSGVTVVTVEGESGVPDERELDRLSAVGAELGLLQ